MSKIDVRKWGWRQMTILWAVVFLSGANLLVALVILLGK